MNDTGQTTPSLNSLATAFVNAAPSLNPFEQKLALALYRLLAQNKAVVLSTLATECDGDIQLISTLLRKWPGVYFDDEGDVIGYWGLTIKPMPHQLIIGDKTLYTWCAWDGLFIPDLINTPATLTTQCPVSSETLMVNLNGQGGFDTPTPDLVMSFLKPEEGLFNRDIIGQFCHYIYLFKDKTLAAEWIHENPGTVLLSLQDAIQLGQLKNQRQYGIH